MTSSSRAGDPGTHAQSAKMSGQLTRWPIPSIVSFVTRSVGRNEPSAVSGHLADGERVVKPARKGSLFVPFVNQQPAYAGAFAMSQWQTAEGAVPTSGTSESREPAATFGVVRGERPRRRWRRFLLSGLLVLLIAALAAGGYLWHRTETTLHEIHSVSTPPPELSGAVLGGNPGLKIKTTTGQATGDAPTKPPTQAPAVASAGTPAAAVIPESTAPVSGAAPAKPTQAAQAVATTAPKDTDGTNILVMGVDARPGQAIDVGVRPDALMVLHLNSATGTCHILAVPRDTRTMLSGYGMTKINHALALGGIPFEESVVEQLLGIKIDHYALIDFTGFQDVVNDLGGVTIDVPDAVTIEGRFYPAGPQTLNGAEALAYARYRGGPDGDFGRIKRQQQLIRAIVDKAISGNIITKINTLLPAFAAHVRTDLGPLDMLKLGREYESTCRGDRIEMDSLTGQVETLPDPVLNMDLSYVIVDPAEIHRKVAELLVP